MEKSLKHNVVYSSILTCANYIFPLIVYPYVSRVLGVANIGLVNFIDSIINYFILFSMMGITIMGIREIASSKNNLVKLNQAFLSVLTLNAISTLITVAALIISIYTVPQLYENKTLMWYGVAKLISNLFLIEWFYKGIEDFKYITIRSILVKCSYVMGVFICVRGIDDVSSYYMLTVLAVAINAISNIAYSKKYVTFTTKRLRLGRLIKPFFILGLYSLLTSMYTTFNITFLGFTTDDTQVGYYITATKLFSILLAIFSAFTGVMMPRMSVLLSEGEHDEFHSLLQKSFDILSNFAFPVIIFCEIFASQIIYLISGPGYDGAIIPFRIVLPMIFIVGYEQILVIQTLMPAKQDRYIMFNSIIGAAIGVLLNILLVKHFMAIGSSIVWIISEITILILSLYVITSRLHIDIPQRNTMICLLRYLPLCIILYLATILDIGLIYTMFIGAGICIAYTIIIIMILEKDSYCAKIIQCVARKFIKY